MCMFTFGSVIESGWGWGRGLPFSLGGWVLRRQKKKRNMLDCNLSDNSVSKVLSAEALLPAMPWQY